MYKTCPDCGHEFYADQPWKRLCLNYWIKRKNAQKNGREDIGNLKMKLMLLRNEREFLNEKIKSQDLLIEKLAHRVSLMDELKPRLRNLISLSHPDKHGGSQTAHDVTVWLLSLKEKAANAGRQAAF